MSEFSFLFNLSTCSTQPAEDSTNVSSLLHADDSELVFFIYPHEECLFIVVIDASTLRPISIQATCFKESISFFEKEVISNQLFLLLRCHRW